LPQVLDLLSIYPATNRAPYLVGPAGSGKTTIAIQAADSLGLPFFSTGAVFDKFELLGFQNAGGEYVKSALFKAYTQGGVFLFDEIDASAPEAMVAFNQLVANGVYTFPDGELHHKHDDFLPMAAANTIGNGATRRYAARVPLDGATLDRFNQLEITYDAALEKRLMIEAGTVINADVCRQSLSAWLATVRTARTWADKQQLDVLITPRDSIAGAALIARGWELPAIKAATIHSKLTADQIAQLARA
jgi:MoxR-like ATPase